MIDSIKCTPLFPSSVFVLDLKDDFSKLKNLKKYFYNETEYGKNAYLTKRLDVLNDFPEEKEVLKLHVDFIKNEFLLYKNVDFEITTSWGTKCVSGGYSQYHQHKNSFYSAVFYYDDDYENCGDLQFQNFHNPSSFYINSGQVSLHTAEIWNFDIAPNRLIVFPSYLYHRIKPSKNQSKERYSLAFNLYPVGNYGENDSSVNVEIANELRYK